MALRHPLLRVYLALFTVQVLFGMHYLATDYGVEYIPPLTWAGLRICIAAVLMLVLFRREITVWPRGLGQWSTVLKLAMLGMVINQGCFALGLARTTPTHAALINATIPVLTLAIAIGMGNERPRTRRVLAVAVALSGALVLLEIERFDPSSDTVIGDLLILTNAISFAFFLILSKPVMARIDPRREQEDEEVDIADEVDEPFDEADEVDGSGTFQATPLGLTTLVVLGGAPILAILGAPGAASMSLADWAALPGWFWVAFVFVILGATVGTYSLNYYALARVQSSQVALFVYLQPLVAGILSIGLDREDLTVRLVVAGLLICLGVGLSVERSGEAKPSAEDPLPPTSGI